MVPAMAALMTRIIWPLVAPATTIAVILMFIVVQLVQGRPT